MKRLFPLFLLIGLLAFGCKSDSNSDSPADTSTSTETSSPETTSEEPEEEVVEVSSETNSGDGGVLIHISTGTDAFKFLLGLDMAEKMANEGREVMVYFDHQAVNAVLIGAKDISYNPLTSMNEQMTKLKALGVKLRVCKPCLGAIWKTPTDLVKGVELAEPAEMLTFSGGPTLTLSY